MRKLLPHFIVLLSLLFSISSNAIAQALPPLQPEQDACGALELCGNIFYTPYSYSGPGNLLEYQQINGNCFGETNSVWFKLKVATAGNIIFKIIPIDSFNDYDFAVWNMTGLNCANVSSITNIRCNGNTILPPGAVPAGIVGLNMTSTTLFVPGGTFGQPWCQYIAANVGDEYLILVDNFSASASGFTIDFTGSTAVFDQGTLPAFLSESHTCDNSKLTVEITKPIKCSSIAADGSDFNVDGTLIASAATGVNCLNPNGYTTTVKVQFPSSIPGGPHTLGIQPGTDLNTLLDICGGAMPTTSTLAFTMPAVINPYVKQIDTPACKSLMLTIDHDIKCNTVAADGSDFKVTGPEVVNVIAATPIGCDAQGMADSIFIEFAQAITTNGAYTLGFQKGNDNSFVADTCNYELAGDVTWNVRDNDGLNATANPALLCDPGYTQLDANPNTPMQKFAWLPGYKVGDSTAISTSAYITNTQTFYIHAIDQKQCTKRDTVEVILSVRNPQLTVDLNDTVLCYGDSVQLFASGGVDYLWWPVDGLSCSTCASPVATPITTTTYFVQISDSYKCADILHQTITVNPLPLVDAGPDKSINYGESVELHATASTTVAYTWKPSGTLSNPLIPNPIARPLETTSYAVIVLDANKCYNMDTVTVFVNKESNIFIPSAFSPNGDGINDVFRVTNTYMPVITEFRIFNRWGQELYSGVGTNAQWDGRYKGEIQEAGVYFYVIKMSWPSGRIKSYNGDVTLVK